jgi:RNA polymerase-binding transcription factor DksA
LNINFTAMEDQLKMYQQAIEQLEKVQLKAVELEVKRMKIATFGICVGLLATAFFLLF